MPVARHTTCDNAQGAWRCEPGKNALIVPLPNATTVPVLPEGLTQLTALEVIREIVGFGEGLVGRLLMVDARDMRFETVNYGWDPANPLSGKTPTIKDLSIHPAGR